MSKSTNAVTRPLVKVFLDMVDTSLKFLVPFLLFASRNFVFYGAYNKVHVVVEEFQKSNT